METYIPDLSHHNGAMNWKAFKDSGTPFIIFKGTESTSIEDSTLRTNIKACETYEIPYWIYAYLHKGNEKAQAQFLVKTCKSLVGYYGGNCFVGYILDAEEGNAAKDLYSALDVARAASPTGKVMFYGSSYLWKKIVANGSDKNAVFWYPRYGKNDGTYDPKYAPDKLASLHQFTDKGVTNYIKDTVDLNRLTGVTPLEWFTTLPMGSVKANLYTGPSPSFPARGYFKLNDGITTYKTYQEEIKKVQKMLNWMLDEDLVVDGMYGKLTRASVEMAQAKLGVTVDGYFGPKTLEALLKYAK